MNLFVDVAGWLGAVVILAAYGLLAAHRIDGRSRAYHLLNLLGAAGIALNSGWNGAMPSAILNVIWAAIAIYALIGAQKMEWGA